MAVKVINHSLKVKAEFAKNIEKALLAVSLYAEGEIKRMAAVDTGALRASITGELQGKTRVRIGSTLNYAVYQEFGTGIYAVNGNGRQTKWRYTNRHGKTFTTRGNKPRPFIMPAIENNIQQIVTIFETNLRME
jgi:HK97 gp10 family phage protein